MESQKISELNFPQQVIFKKFLQEFIPDETVELFRILAKDAGEEEQSEDSDVVEIIENFNQGNNNKNPNQNQNSKNNEVQYEYIPAHPKKWRTQFVYFIQAFKEKHPEIKHKEIFVEAGKEWTLLSESDKAPFNELSAKDKEREIGELEQLKTKGYFINEDGVSSKDIPPKKIKVQSTNKLVPQTQFSDYKPMKEKDMTPRPKGASSAYMQYVKANIQDVLKDQREKNSGGSAATASKVLGAKWQEMNDEQKKPYYELHQQDRIRYQTQMAEFNKTGNWTLTDGTNSKELTDTKIKRGKRVYA